MDPLLKDIILNIDKFLQIDRNNPLESSYEALMDKLEKTCELCRILNQIIEHAPDGIYVTDGEANAIRINPAFERISGLNRKDMLGLNHRELEEKKVVSRSSALMVVQQRKTVTIIHEYLPTNRQALVTSIPVFDENEEISLIVSSTRDLTELNDLKSKLAAEKERRLNYERQIEVIKSQIIDTEEIIAVDKKTLDMLSAAIRVAMADSTVFITGETGTGKEKIAKYIHKRSLRKDAPFIAINCGAIPKSLAESEFFGYVRGAFTGARQDGKPGILEVANKGTVFLDEVGELPMDIQVKLLRAFEERAITRVGDTRRIPIDVRIITATNKDLEEMVKVGKFREELYYRLRIIPIHIPALRERIDDIIPLVNYFLRFFNDKSGYKKKLSYMAYRILLNYSWPGNVRELKNVIERIVVMSDNDEITAEDLPMHQEVVYAVSQEERVISMKERLERIEYTCMMEAFAKHKSVHKAAASLKMSVPTFIRKRDKYSQKFLLQK
jgi:PAS domain S-box-containing protein